MGKEIKVRIIMRWNDTTGWSALTGADSVLAKGEIGIEYIPGSALPKLKIGNGASSWQNLPYFETSLPKNFTWGNLRGTTLQTEASKTSNLELTKPGFTDAVNIVTLNKNFEKIDSYYNLKSEEINNLGERITNLSNLLSSTPSDWSSLASEVAGARTINGKTYDSLSNALDSLNNDLQTFKIKLDDIIGKAMPSKLMMEEDGMLYLADSEGNPIDGSGALVKDNALSAEVAGIRTRFGNAGTYNTAYEATQAIDSELQQIRTRQRTGDTKPLAADVITEIDDELRLVDNELKRIKNDVIPDGLIYENNLLYLAVQNEAIGDPVEITGGGGGIGGGGFSYVITLTNEMDSRIFSVAENTPVKLKFNYTSIDNEGIADGSGAGELLIDNLKVAGFTLPQGSYELDVTSYLQKGTNNLKIKVTNSEGSYRSLTYTVTVMALSISSTFPTMGTYNLDSVGVGYTLNGEGVKTVYFVLTKQVTGARPQVLGSETTNSTGQARQFYVKRPSSSGSYTLEIYATAGSGETMVYSNTLRIGMIWYSDSDTEPFILLNTNQVKAVEGETIQIPYMVYHPAYEQTLVEFNIIQHKTELEDGTIGDKIFSHRTATIDRVSKVWTIQTFPPGEVSFRISCENTSNYVTMQVQKSDFDKTIIQNNLLLEFNATGRQNSDDNKDQWEYKGIKATFNNVGWSAIDGWYLRDKENGEEGEKEEQTVLRLLPGSSMFLPFYPFEEDITSTGYTIEAEIATQNVSDYDSIMIESFSGGRGFLIKSQSAQMSSTGSSITAQFKEDEKVRLTFVVEQYTSNRLITIYINGVSCGIQQYPQNDIFTHPNGEAHGITVGADSCGIDIYFLRFYNIPFTATQQLNNFIVDRPTLAERIEKNRQNSIINENTDMLSKKITINSLNGSIPYIIMECPELPQFKGDKKKNMSFTFVDPKNPERSFTAQKVQFDVQGTSSAGYPVKNFKLKLGKLNEGGGIIYTQTNEAAEGFKFRGDDSLITKVFCLKADYASSENANNVMLVDYYNQTCPYRNVAQEKDERVRWGVHGEPIVLFWRNTSTNEIYFQGKYNMNDDKDNENVFGFVDILNEEDYPNIECWELLNNNTSLCLFQDGIMEKVNDDGSTSYLWVDSFERRFPEQEETITDNDVSRLTRLVQWIASTNTTSPSNNALTSPTFYRTRDKVWNEKKTYYSNKNLESIKNIEKRGTINSYSDEVTIVESDFRTKIGAVNFEDLIDEWSCSLDSKTNIWTLKRYSQENFSQTIPSSELSNWGITVAKKEDQTFKVEEFSFKYLTFGFGFSNALYEYHTVDTADYRLSKFNDEFENYFVKEPMSYYYVFTETFLLMDSRAKNMFLMTFDGEHWFPSPYDMDTALGINNEGQLVFDYNLEDTDTSSGAMIYNGKDKLYDGTKTYFGSLDTENNKFISTTGEEIDYKGALVFNGQESVLWNNFRDCFYDDIQTMYRALRSQTGEKNGSFEFSFEKISKKMNEHQDMWPEVLWNIDQQIKYLEPFYAGVNNLAMAQGDKRTQRNFWMFNTFKYRDSKYMTADSVNNYIHLRIYNKGTISVVPYSHIYARVEFGNAKDEQKRAFRNEIVEFNTDGIATVNDLETHIFSSDRISKIGDLSDFYIGYCDFSMAPKLQEIIVGSEKQGYINGNLTAFTLGTSELLRLVNISNCNKLTSTIDASKCPTLKVFKAKGSAISGVNFSVGGRLEEYYAPNTIKTLILREQSHLNTLDITTDNEGKYQLTTLWISKTPNVSFFNLIKNSPNLEYLRLDDISWNTTETELQEFFNLALKPEYENGVIKNKKMGSLDGEGRPIIGGGAIVTGKVYVPSISDDFLYLMNEHFPNLTIYVNNIPKFFIRYVTYDNKFLYSYIAEGGSSAIDPTRHSSVDSATQTAIYNAIKTRPSVDSNGDGTEDTFYHFRDDIRWESLPTNIQQSYTIRPAYTIKYLTRYYYEEGGALLHETQTERNSIPIDPVAEGKIDIPTKATTAQYTFEYFGWSPSLTELTEPRDYYVVFSEIINKYTVKFISGEKELTSNEQLIDYGGSPYLPNTSIVKKYYKDGINENGETKYSYYEIYEHIGWDIYNDGDIEVDFEEDPNMGLIIKPKEYTTEPIKVYAVFSAIEPITDTWDIIIENCNNGNYKTKYPVGTQKEIKFVYNSQEYSGIVEVVEQDRDPLSSDGSKMAGLTFILKDIFLMTTFRNNPSHTWNEIVGPLAGGWTDHTIYQNLKNITFKDVLENDQSVLLNENIKSVIKKTDFGPARTNADTYEYYPTDNLAERIWTPSASEMGVLSSNNPAVEAQQGKTYIWFTNNESRIKKYGDKAERYWTRTWEGSPYRFYGIGADGGYAYDISLSNPAMGILSFENAGLIFGFCI